MIERHPYWCMFGLSVIAWLLCSNAIRMFFLDVCSPVIIHPGEDISEIISMHPAGTTFHLKPGVYVEQTIKPRPGDVFVSDGGAVMSGNTCHGNTWKGLWEFNLDDD